MAASKTLINMYTSVPKACRDCGGRCYNANESIRQQNYSNAFPGKAKPNPCIGKNRCPAINGAL